MSDVDDDDLDELAEVEAGHHIVFTPQSVVINLSPELQRAAKACIKRSGKATFTMKEVSVSRLPETRLGNGVLVD